MQTLDDSVISSEHEMVPEQQRFGLQHVLLIELGWLSHTIKSVRLNFTHLGQRALQLSLRLVEHH